MFVKRDGGGNILGVYSVQQCTSGTDAQGEPCETTSLNFDELPNDDPELIAYYTASGFSQSNIDKWTSG